MKKIKDFISKKLHLGVYEVININNNSIEYLVHRSIFDIFTHPITRFFKGYVYAPYYRSYRYYIGRMWVKDNIFKPGVFLLKPAILDHIKYRKIEDRFWI